MARVETLRPGPPALEASKHQFATALRLKTLDVSLPRISKASELSPSGLLPDIESYIPVGCIRVRQSDSEVSTLDWEACDTWRSVAHSRDNHARLSSPPLESQFQCRLIESEAVWFCRILYLAGWIKLEFKVNSQRKEDGQLRIYVLPDDCSRLAVHPDRDGVRPVLLWLLESVDTARDVWLGDWDSKSPVQHVDPCLDDDYQPDETSLLETFNKLPSPAPDPNICKDPDIRYAMDQILQSNIEGLKTTLYPYQRRTAALMLQREAEPGQLADPRLRHRLDQQGRDWYFDLDTGYCFRDAQTYEGTRGGICAETMGLGKTLICLALIMATRELYSQIPPEYSIDTIPNRPKVGSLVDMCGATIGRTGTPWKTYLKSYEDQGYELTRCYDAIRRGQGYYLIPAPPPRRATRNPVILPPKKIYLSTTTLVVVPSNLINQWRREISKHTTGLSVSVVTGSNPVPPALEIAELDILLMSRQRFDMEVKDGSDAQGRRGPTGSCKCGFYEWNRDINCSCFNIDKVYRSPLRQVRFKRMVVDEGHIMGNSSNASKSNVVRVSQFLEVEAKFILSGTPTQNLYGLDIGINGESLVSDSASSDVPLSARVTEQERKDLEKLGNIATNYLQLAPWTTSRGGYGASWSQYVMQPRHGVRKRGNMDCLRSTLANIIIRHRPEDVQMDVQLPPLYSKVVYLEPSLQDKLSMNLFSLMITSNAVTSERKDEDYLFHPKQRAALGSLVSNLRQASFYWSGWQADEVLTTIEIAERFLEKREVLVSSSDEALLKSAIAIGRSVLANKIWAVRSEFHEVPVYVENNLPGHICKAWSLDENAFPPSMLGLTQLHQLQKLVNSQLQTSEICTGLENAGLNAIDTAREAQAAERKPVYRAKAKVAKLMQHRDKATPALAGGVNVGHDTSPRKMARAASAKTGAQSKSGMTGSAGISSAPKVTGSTTATNARHSGRYPVLNMDDLLEQSKLLSTASAKLSYLLDQVLLYQKDEKIIIFYEADNVAYYTAQALECLGIEHLIYAKTLTAERKSSYIVTFNTTEKFRVLLMDITQAAFGLDMSSASRVFFVNPVLNRTQVEAQAIKRAHRIGQRRPVYVETLVLRFSIEEAIVQRRDLMTSDEQKKCKSVLDDRTLYDWIKNVAFVPLPEEDIPGPDQMAPLHAPQRILGLSDVNTYGKKLDLHLVAEELSPVSEKGKGKVLEEKAASNHAVPSQPNGNPRVRFASDNHEEEQPSSKRVRIQEIDQVSRS